MDRLDVRILGALVHDRQANPALSGVRLPIRKISQRLGINDDTVRNRIEKMQDSGFLRGWALFPNPNAFGLRGAEVWMEICTHPKRAAIQSLLRVPGVVTIVDLLGAEAIAVVFYDQSVPEGRLLQRVESAASVGELDLLAMRFSRCEVALSATDIDICKTLQMDPLLTYKEISEKLGISSKTVRRRVKLMIEANALFLQPSLDAKSLEGVVWTNILVFYDSPSAKPGVDRQIMALAGDTLVRAELNNPAYGFFTLFLPNLPLAQELFERIDRTHVSRARMGFVREFIAAYEAFKSFTAGRSNDETLGDSSGSSVQAITSLSNRAPPNWSQRQRNAYTLDGGRAKNNNDNERRGHDF